MNDICSKRRQYGNGIAADLIHLISSQCVQMMPNVTFTSFIKKNPFLSKYIEMIVVFTNLKLE